MSVESLLGETRAYLVSYNAVKAGEQLFFGGKHLYTDISNVASTSGHAEGKTRQGSSHVKDAVAAAKKIAQDGLKGSENSKMAEDVRLLKQEVSDLRKSVEELRDLLIKLKLAEQSAKESGLISAAAPVPAAASAAADDDEDIDLFGSDDEEDDEEKQKITEQRLAEYAAKKAKKPGPIAKSSVILDVKGWDDECDMGEVEKLVRGIEQDGLVWGGAKLIPLAYGIKKLQIICVIEDLKVSVDDLIEKITGDFEELVQSVDIAAFNKI